MQPKRRVFLRNDPKPESEKTERTENIIEEKAESVTSLTEDKNTVKEIIQTTDPPEEKQKRNKMLILISIAVLLIIAIFTVFLLRDNTNNSLVSMEDQIKAQLGQLENKTNEEIQAALDELIEEGSIRISINTNPVFIDGSAKGSLQIENHPNNHYNMRCTITMDVNNDSQEDVIYQSGLMPVNSHIQSDVLTVALPKGEYPATATFKAYDVSTDTEVGTAIAKLTISVLN